MILARLLFRYYFGTTLALFWLIVVFFFVSDSRMVVEDVLLGVLLLLLVVLLSLPNLRLLHSILTTNQHPNVFDRGLALCLVTSGKGTTVR